MAYNYKVGNELLIKYKIVEIDDNEDTEGIFIVSKANTYGFWIDFDDLEKEIIYTDPVRYKKHLTKELERLNTEIENINKQLKEIE